MKRTGMTLDSVSVTRLHSVVVDALEEPILSGKLKPGEMLPAEKELAAQLKVGRRAVREALRILQNKGLVEVRMGVGTFVLRNDLDTYLGTLMTNVNSYLATRRAEVHHVLQFREIIESSALRKLIVAGDSTPVAALRANLEEQRRAQHENDPDRYNVVHAEFHRAIVATLNNPVVEMVYDQVRSLIADLLITAGRSAEQQARSIAEHTEIVDALESGNWPACETAIKNHLALAYRVLMAAAG